MTDQAAAPQTSAEGWQAKQVYAMAAVCLVVGLAIGYLFRGSQSPAARPIQATNASQPTNMGGGITGQMPTLDQMKHMADKKAEPLLAKLQADPNNAALLVQLGDVYKQTHQFKEAADYYQRSLKSDPGNAGVRSDLASVMYYNGDVEGALAQLQQALQSDPKNGAALFNLGMIKYQAKKDAAGAITAWRELLKTNPTLPAERKAAVEKLIAEAQNGAHK